MGLIFIFVIVVFFIWKIGDTISKCIVYDRSYDKEEPKLKTYTDKENFLVCPLIRFHLMCHRETVTDDRCSCLYDRKNYIDKAMIRTFGCHCPFRKNDECVLINLVKENNDESII